MKKKTGVLKMFLGNNLCLVYQILLKGSSLLKGLEMRMDFSEIDCLSEHIVDFSSKSVTTGCP